jgi:hypothetical protein
MHRKTLKIGVLLLAGSVGSVTARASNQPVTAQLQQIVDSYLAQQQQNEEPLALSCRSAWTAGSK